MRIFQLVILLAVVFGFGCIGYYGPPTLGVLAGVLGVLGILGAAAAASVLTDTKARYGTSGGLGVLAIGTVVVVSSVLFAAADIIGLVLSGNI